MEALIEQFFSVDRWSGYGYGYGYWSGYGSGDGYGDGCWSGCGYGYGYGDGSGDEDGYWSGAGDGSGYGYGDGSGDEDGYWSGAGDGSGYEDGCGSGDGYGGGVTLFCGLPVVQIDGIATVVHSIRGDVLKGAILVDDLTTRPTFVVKRGNLFAHGESLKDAVSAVEEKRIALLDVDTRLAEFDATFNRSDSYPVAEFFRWHGALTGSCEQGRRSFVESRGIDLSSSMTVAGFLGICRGQYGWDVVKRVHSGAYDQAVQAEVSE